MKDTAELRAFLADQMERVVEGKTTAERAKGVANLAQQIYNSLNMEVKMAQMKAKAEKEGVSIEPVRFG